VKLTVKQQRFVDFYDGNATQAALKAGYSEKTAHSIGQENLKKPVIIQAIESRLKKEDASKIATRQERQEFWTTTLRSDEVDQRDRLKASELLGRSECDFIDTTRLEGSIDINATLTDQQLEDKLLVLIGKAGINIAT
jgi:phage terminase small subunit